MTDSPVLLAFDCAGAACSAAVLANGAVRARQQALMKRGQSEHLVPMIEAVLTESGLGYGDLTAIAVTTGPGGFTGVRIGLATAHGLALATGRPAIGISCFEVLAAAVPTAERSGRCLATLIDAKRADLFYQCFDETGQTVTAPAAAEPDALAEALPAGPLLLAGDAVEQAVPALEAAGRDVLRSALPGAIDAADLARLAAERDPHEAGRPQPLYLRAPDVTLPRPATG